MRQNKVSKGVNAGLPGTENGWIAYHGAVAAACRKHFRTDKAGRVLDRDLANLCALFIAACYKWRGKSKQGGAWFSKTDAQWCAELGLHKERLWDVIRFVCIDDAKNEPLGVPSIGIIRRRTAGRFNTAEYLVDDARALAWWHTSGLQPTLATPDEPELPQSASALEALFIRHKRGELSTNGDALSTMPKNLWITTPSGGGKLSTMVDTSCQRSLTLQTKISVVDWELRKNENALQDAIAADHAFITLVLSSVFGNRWKRTLDRTEPVNDPTPEHRVVVEQMRRALKGHLDRALEQYFRDDWGMMDEMVLFELIASCSYLDVHLDEVKFLGSAIKMGPGGLIKNPTGMLVYRLRQVFARRAGLVALVDMRLDEVDESKAK